MPPSPAAAVRFPVLAPLLGLIAGLAACTPTPQVVGPVPYAQAPPGLPDSLYRNAVFDQVNAPPLAATPLPATCEEVRLHGGHGMQRDYPIRYLRLVRCGHSYRGEVVVGRTTYEWPCPWPAPDGVCVGRARLLHHHDWRPFWLLLDSLSIWDLPSYQELRRRNREMFDVADGGALNLQWRRGAEYRHWDYPAPEARQWPEARRATTVMRAFHVIVNDVALTNGFPQVTRP